MGIFRTKQPNRTITAAAGGVISGGNPAMPDAIMRRKQEWQKRVLAYADSVPEVSAASSFLYNSLQRVTFRVEGVIPEHAETLERQLKGFPAGRSAQNIFLIGELIVAYEYDAAKKKTCWYSYGYKDYEAADGKPLKIRPKSGKSFVPMPANRKAFRLWREDPSNMYEAWSPHKSLTDLLEAMYVHQLADTAVATSRLAGAGILYVPNDDLPSVPVPDNGKPEPGTQEEFAALLGEAMMQSIKVRNAADAVVPMIQFGSSEHAAGLKHILMERPDDAKAFATRMQSYRERYATGIDLPAELITGLGDANHWSAWKVDQNTWTYYLAPMAQLIAEALLQNFVEPVARAMDIPTENLCVVADGSKVVAKPDRTDPAIRLRQLGVLSREAAAAAAGFGPQDLDPVEYAPSNTRLEQLPTAYRDMSPVSAAAGYTDADLESFSKSVVHADARANKKLHRAWSKYYRKMRASGAQVDDGDRAAVAAIVALLIRERLAATARLARYNDPLAVAASYDPEIAPRAQLAQLRFFNALQAAAASNRDYFPPGVLAMVDSIAAGGINDLEGAAVTGTIQDVGTDPLVRAALDSAGVPYRIKYRWDHGDPNHPFPPHVLLEGREWLAGDQPEFLTEGAWVVGGAWHPGDHPGCTCSYSIEFELL